MALRNLHFPPDDDDPNPDQIDDFDDNAAFDAPEAEPQKLLTFQPAEPIDAAKAQGIALAAMIVSLFKMFWDFNRSLRRAYLAFERKRWDWRQRAKRRYAKFQADVREAIRQERIARVMAFPTTGGDAGGPYRVIGMAVVEALVPDTNDPDVSTLGFDAALEILRDYARYLDGNAVIHVRTQFEDKVLTKRNAGKAFANQLF